MMLRKFAVTGLLAGIPALMLAFPAAGKVKPGDKGPAGGAEATSQSVLSATVFNDAFRLCNLLVNDQRALLDALESSGWTHEVDYDLGNAPYYKEITATHTYEGVGEAEIWGFMENYPTRKIGFCSFAIVDPQITFDFEAVNGQDALRGEMEREGEQTFGTWESAGPDPDTFVHSYQSEGNFIYQVTKINKVD